MTCSSQTFVGSGPDVQTATMGRKMGTPGSGNDTQILVAVPCPWTLMISKQPVSRINVSPGSPTSHNGAGVFFYHACDA